MVEKKTKIKKLKNSIVQLTASELEKVQEIWTTIQKKLQLEVLDHYSRNRIKVRLYELFHDEVETNY